jgi:hypothetical protein
MEWFAQIDKIDLIMALVDGLVAYVFYRYYIDTKNRYYLMISRLFLGFGLLNVVESGIHSFNISNRYIELGISSIMLTVGNVLFVLFLSTLPPLFTDNKKYFSFVRILFTKKGIGILTLLSVVWVAAYTAHLIH